MNTTYTIKLSVSQHFNRNLLTITRIDRLNGHTTIICNIYSGSVDRNTAALILNQLNGFKRYSYRNQFYGITRVYSAKFQN